MNSLRRFTRLTQQISINLLLMLIVLNVYAADDSTSIKPALPLTPIYVPRAFMLDTNVRTDLCANQCDKPLTNKSCPTGYQANLLLAPTAVSMNGACGFYRIAMNGTLGAPLAPYFIKFSYVYAQAVAPLSVCDPVGVTYRWAVYCIPPTSSTNLESPPGEPSGVDPNSPHKTLSETMLDMLSQSIEQLGSDPQSGALKQQLEQIYEKLKLQGDSGVDDATKQLDQLMSQHSAPQNTGQTVSP